MTIGLNDMSDRARAYPAGDAQGQHPAPVGSGLGLSHLTVRMRRKKLARRERHVRAGCDESMKERFWEEFDSMIMGIPDSEEIYIGGDFNGHVGRVNDGYERVHGGWGYGMRNSEGETLLQAAVAFDLAVLNTWFQKRDQHLITYKSGNHATQIDYFLIRRNRINCVKNCKVLPGEDLVSQHRILLADVSIAVRPNKNKVCPPPKIKWHLLQNNEYASEFREQVVTKMLEMGEMEGMSANECWLVMAGYIRSVAKNVFGETKGKRMIDKEVWWWNESVQEVLREKKKAFKEWQMVEDENETLKESKKEVYKECKKRAKRTVAICRAEAQDNLYRSLERPEGQKRLYQIARARERNGRDISHVKCIKDDSGKILTDDESIKERWKKYFEKLMNEKNEWNGVLENPPLNLGLVREISVEEVKVAVRNMKNGKAVGPDGIPVEVWKLLSADGWKWLSVFFDRLVRVFDPLLELLTASVWLWVCTRARH
ncbi:uncharacterized protein LOC125237330 [Leguminivora glycinivorella]|uniref:uncharacterized protein LOC125237330 n=1 Tax=Leguminivora glycinivorella TaxID=1035111 RepID=UPI00200E9D5F|nr:uncharacterized protein LOC125237330 [Leguminivora glycinivorella]